MFGVAVVGVGMVAGIHAQALRDLGDLVKVVGVYDRDQGRLTSFCETWGYPAAASLEELLASAEVQAVIVLTPPNVRRDIVAAAAAAGKHLLLEKPLERTTAGARELVEIAKAHGVTLGGVFQHRFRESSVALRERIASGELGELATVRVSVPWWRPQSYYDEPGRGTYARDGGGVLINQAIHTLDLMQMYAGAVSEVTAMLATSRLHRMEAEDFVAAGIRFESGAVGSIMATTAAFPGGAESIVLGFANAAVTLESGAFTISFHDGRTETFGETSSTGGGADPMAFTHDWHTSALRDFFTSVAAGRPSAVSGSDAVSVLRLIDALTLSGREGRMVKLDEVK